MLRSIVLGAAALLIAAPVQAASGVTCVGGAYIIVARDSSDTSSGAGKMGSIATGVASAVPSSTVVPVDYSPSQADYKTTEAQGVKTARSLLLNYVDACPGHHVVMMGYVQGAQVVGDVIVGASESGFPADGPVASNYQNAVVALIQMGDPSHIPGEPGSVGNATNPGIFARKDVSVYNSSGIAPRRQTYCDANDVFCDSGASFDVQGNYVNEYGSAAQSFVVSAYSSASSSSAAAAASSTSAPTTTSGAAASSGATGTASVSASVTAAPTSVNSLYAYGGADYTGTVTSGAFTNPPELPYSGVGGAGVGGNSRRNDVVGAIAAIAAFAVGML